MHIFSLTLALCGKITAVIVSDSRDNKLAGMGTQGAYFILCLNN